MSSPLLSPKLATAHPFYIQTKAQSGQSLLRACEVSHTQAVVLAHSWPFCMNSSSVVAWQVQGAGLPATFVSSSTLSEPVTPVSLWSSLEPSSLLLEAVRPCSVTWEGLPSWGHAAPQ